MTIKNSNIEQDLTLDDNTLIQSSTESEIQPSDAQSNIEEETEPFTRIVTIVVNLPEAIMQIGYVFNSTGETNMVTVSNGKLHMMQNRTYYVPINSNVDSDEYTIKIPSEIADKIDVRFVKDGFACIVPLQHNVILRHEQRICILFPNS